MSQVAWQMSVIFIPVIVGCFWYQSYYISAARELTRLTGVCKATLIQHFSESLSGSTTIRGFDQEFRFMGTNMQWLGFRLDMLSSVIFAFFLVFLISVPDGTIDPG
ncbi:hypothetical protein ACHQM5_026504 [Ranunculus cassubicifolius]